jgi:hypothetical protein
MLLMSLKRDRLQNQAFYPFQFDFALTQIDLFQPIVLSHSQWCCFISKSWFDGHGDFLMITSDRDEWLWPYDTHSFMERHDSSVWCQMHQLYLLTIVSPQAHPWTDHRVSLFHRCGTTSTPSVNVWLLYCTCTPRVWNNEPWWPNHSSSSRCHWSTVEKC